MVDKNLALGTVVIAAALTVVIMSGMFYFGGVLQDAKVEDMSSDLQRLEIDRRSQEISRAIASDMLGNDCRVLDASISWAVKNLGELERKIEDHEDTERFEGDGFRMLKREYTNLLLDYWLLMREAEKECGVNKTRIVYFYAYDDVCPMCDDQGTILTHYRQKYVDDILVFPLDVTLDMDPVDLLIDAYVLDDEGEAVYPTMKINGEVYRGFVGMEELGEILEEEIENGYNETEESEYNETDGQEIIPLS